MHTHQNVKRILVYGDSLVYGKKPGVNQRWDSNTRFTGVIQDRLGNGYEIIEEGLRGRTLKGENTFFPERNGLDQFGPTVGSHLSVDLIILALGSNDCNATGDIAENAVETALDLYRDKISDWSTFLGFDQPKLLLVSPPHIVEEYYDKSMKVVFGGGASKKQLELEKNIVDYAKSNNVDYLKASGFCKPTAPGDGIHLNEKSNNSLGEALSKKVLEII